MTLESLSLPRMRDTYQKETADLRLTFERSGDGSASIRRRSTLVDKIVRQLWVELLGDQSDLASITVVATGGFGRKELFPHSDVDVLFLCANDSVERELHGLIRTLYPGHVGCRIARQPGDSNLQGMRSLRSRQP